MNTDLSSEANSGGFSGEVSGINPGKHRADIPAESAASSDNCANAYARAGVDTQAGDRAVELMKAAVQATQGPEVLGGTGGFAGLYDA